MSQMMVDYNECESCGEMLVLAQCSECKKRLCTRCQFYHECKDGVWICE